MFERFTDRARRVVVLAQEEARMLNHNYMGTEHILAGLIREEEGVAARALGSLGISLDGVRQQVEEIAGRGPLAPSGHIPFTPRAKKVIDRSLREMLQFGHNNIGTEHILLGLIREGESVAAQILVRLGADLNRVRERTLTIMSAAIQAKPAPTPIEPEPASARVFVSYRRDDTSHAAGRVSDWLCNHLGDGQVFMDVDSIELGVDFADAISAAVGRCDVLIAVIGRQWSDARLEDADDIVRLEVEAALSRNIRVIPVLVDSAEMPAKQDLPASLATLTRRNALRIRHESFRQDVRRLLEAVKTPD